MKKVTILLCCFCLLCNCFSSICFAIENNYVEQNDKLALSKNIQNELTSINSNNQQLYAADVVRSDKTIALQKNEKEFVYQQGEIYKEDSQIYVLYENGLISISEYDWYIVDYNLDLILAANVSVDDEKNEKVVGVFLYPEGAYLGAKDELFSFDYLNQKIIELLLEDQTGNVCTKIIAVIDNESYCCIEKKAVQFDLSRENTDLVSKNLIGSFSFESQFKTSMYHGIMKNQTVDRERLVQGAERSVSINYANENQTIEYNAYDDYTDSDGIINEYIEYYYNNAQSIYAQGSIFQVSDDPIVKIIPRELFINRGVYSYIGKEYGFYINTVQDFLNDNLSSFIVFDIEMNREYPGRNNDAAPPSIEVRPLFSYVANYIANWNVVAMYSAYASPHLALANIQVTGVLNNLNESNIGDSDYVASQDYGYAFNSLIYEAVGTGKNSDQSSIDLGFMEIGLGAFELLGENNPIASNIALVGSALITGIELIDDYYTELNRVNYQTMDELANGNYRSSNSFLGNANTVSMINNYGNLIKGFEARLVDQGKLKEENFPLLYKTDDHYFKTEYSFCQKDSTVNWDSVVALEIMLDIYNDTSTGNNHTIVKKDSVIGGQYYYYNEHPSTSSMGNMQEGKIYHAEFTTDPNGAMQMGYASYVPMEGSCKEFYFTPNRTFNYVIETFNRSPNSDPYLMLYDDAGNQISYNDDGGVADEYSSSPRNAKITRTLNAGSRYKIRALCYGYRAGSYELIIHKSDDMEVGEFTSLHGETVSVNSDSVWYAFSPSVTGCYSLYTVGLCDTVLSLYDSRYNKLDFDDDSGSDFNAQIDLYLLEGETYYLQASLFSSTGIASFDLYVNMQNYLQAHPAYKEASTVYWYVEAGVMLFRYIADSSTTYTFDTDLTIGSPCIKLFDKNMTLLYTKGNSGTGNDITFSYNLVESQVYYIMLYGVSGYQGYGMINIDYDN